MKTYQKEITDYLSTQKLKYEVHQFERAYMIDIWQNSKFICIQVCSGYIGFSAAYPDEAPMAFDSRPDKTFANIDALIAALKPILE